jgi:acyl carrier protein
MELSEFVQKFSNCFDDAQAVEVAADTCYKDIEHWNSMQALIIIAMIDSDYQVTITETDLKSTQTVAELFEAVASKK